MAQPPSSQRIKGLEVELGVELFTRSAKGTTLTAAGAAFLGGARAALEHAERAAAAARAAALGLNRELAVGYLVSISGDFLPAVVSRFAESNPGIEVRLRQQFADAQLGALRAGLLDVGFLRAEVLDKDLASQFLISERLHVALPVGHRLAQSETIAVADLAPESFALFERDRHSAFVDRVHQACVTAGFSPNITLHPQNHNEALVFVAAGQGITIVAVELAGQAPHPGVTFRPLTGSCTMLELHIATKRTPSAETAAFVAAAVSEVSARRNERRSASTPS